jgi:hypothetical protein
MQRNFPISSQVQLDQVVGLNQNGTISPFVASSEQTNSANQVRTVKSIITVPTSDAADVAFCLAAGPKASVYICGTYTGTLKINETSTLTSSVPASTDVRRNAYVAYVDGKNNWLWATRLFSSSGGVYITSCVLEATQNFLYVCGFSEGNVKSDDLPTLNSANLTNTFVAKLNVDTQKWMWIATTQGQGFERGLGVSLRSPTDDAGVFVVGYASQPPRPQDANVSDGTTLASLDPENLYAPAGSDTGSTTANVSQRAVVMNLDASGKWRWVRSAGGFKISAQSNAVCLDAASNTLYVSGQFSDKQCVFTSGDGTTLFKVNNAGGVNSTGVLAAISAETGQWRWAMPMQGTGDSAMTCVHVQNNVLHVAGTVAARSSSSTVTLGGISMLPFASSDTLPRTFIARWTRGLASQSWNLNSAVLVSDANTAPTGMDLDPFAKTILVSALTRPVGNDPLLKFATNEAGHLPARGLLIEMPEKLTLDPSQYSIAETQRPSNMELNDGTCWALQVNSYGCCLLGGGFVDTLRFVDENGQGLSDTVQASGPFHDSFVARFEKSSLLLPLAKSRAGRIRSLTQPSQNPQQMPSRHVQIKKNASRLVVVTDPTPSLPSSTFASLQTVLGVVTQISGTQALITMSGIAEMNKTDYITGKKYYIDEKGFPTLNQGNDRLLLGVALSPSELLLRIQ